MVLSLSKNCPLYFLKHHVSETGFCLRLHVKPTLLGSIDRASPYLRRVGFTWRGKENLVSETLCFKK
jgi:hypothetical protein